MGVIGTEQHIALLTELARLKPETSKKKTKPQNNPIRSTRQEEENENFMSHQ